MAILGSRAKVLAAAVAILAVLGVIVAAAVGDARNWAIAVASHRLGRPVHVDGDLSLRAGLAGPVVRFTDLHVDQPAWAGPGRMASVARGRIDLPWSVLLGDGRLRAVALDGVRLSLRRDAQGRVDWTGNGAGAPLRPPRIDRLVLTDGVLDVQDLQRSVGFHGVMSADATPAGSELKLSGAGTSEGQPWTARVSVARKPSGPPAYALDATLALQGPSGPSSARFLGALALSAPHRLEGALAISGPDLHAFGHLGNLPLPRTPPYSLGLRITAGGGRAELDAISGRVGASELEGAMTVTPQPGGRRLQADLRSSSLRISDLFAVASGGELTARPRTGRLLPDAAINPVPLRKLSGEIRFTAAAVQPPTTPTIRSLQLRVRFDQGVISADPLTLQLAPRGRAVLHLRLDVRGATPHIGFDADVKGADTEDFSRTGVAGAPLQADFDASAHLQGSGASLAAAAGNASGDASLHALGGRLKAVPAEVLSANLARGLISLLTKRQGDVRLRCAVARFHVQDGEAKATALRLSTEAGGAAGYGGLDLKAQTLDITLRPDGAVSGPTSVRIDGPIAHPRATLALDDPRAVLRKALGGLMHAAAPTPVRDTGCR